jgi:3-hydroxy-9,10-secoandrosta-1,3,5(10)-triene-9,17-dione monooxygenase reductase component
MEFESREFRNILGAFATGVVIITTGKDPMFHGMTAQSFSSLSLDPPLVLVCVDKAASMVDFLNESKSFSVNILGASQEDAMWYFASKDRPAPPEEFADVEYTIGETGCPRLSNATTVLDCIVQNVLPGGDHDIFVGEVKAFVEQSPEDPILFYKGRGRSLAAEEQL